MTWHAKSGRRRAHSVRQDWFTWLPAEKHRVFGAVADELETCYSMLSIALDEAFTLRDVDNFARAREQTDVSADLFDRLAVRLLDVFRALEEHGRHFGTLPNVAPLNPEFFRGEAAQHIARKNGLLSKILFSSRLKFFHKLHGVAETVEGLQAEFRRSAEEIADGASLRARAEWQALEILHYDLNTCLREAIVVLKSFLCALPGEQVPSFLQKLDALAHGSPMVLHRRATLF